MGKERVKWSHKTRPYRRSWPYDEPYNKRIESDTRKREREREVGQENCNNCLGPSRDTVAAASLRMLVQMDLHLGEAMPWKRESAVPHTTIAGRHTFYSSRLSACRGENTGANSNPAGAASRRFDHTAHTVVMPLLRLFSHHSAIRRSHFRLYSSVCAAFLDHTDAYGCCFTFSLYPLASPVHL